MANTQINITANGTTTLATAGKYCDRNIDVHVEVPGEPTQFTNLYDPNLVVLQTHSGYSGSTGASFSADPQVNYIPIPYHHAAGEPVELRMRGIGTVRDRMSINMYGEDGTTIVTWGQISSLEKRYDEHGDCVIVFSGTFVNREWHCFHLNFQYDGENREVAAAKAGPIITINEPIGNGGHV